MARKPLPDVDTDDCLPEYCLLLSPDVLQSRVALITGGGSGIGFRTAEIFTRHGCQTIVASRSLEKVTESTYLTHL
uniref:Peroxisomal 2,4-dienoyl-CoA reductase [(3E)-enoyl-CoA-producing] n=1 Tax=Crocodylus porosus TaxID=8502 RepID=A0A7M4ED90_CROPO